MEQLLESNVLHLKHSQAVVVIRCPGIVDSVTDIYKVTIYTYVWTNIPLNASFLNLFTIYAELS